MQSSIDWSLADNFENLILTGTTAVEAIGNELNNSLTGNAADNYIVGADGNDTLNGGAGVDELYGGADNDLYIVDSYDSLVFEDANNGIDTVQSSINWLLADNFENLVLTGTTALEAIGNELDNSITGNSGINNLSGNAGNDTLDGQAGNDGLNGGAGLDRLIGGAGNDILTGGTESDTFVFAVGFGKDKIMDFNALAGVNHDVLQFSTSVFADWNSLLAKTTQVGSDLVITATANDTITLKNVTLSSFTSDDVVFVV